MISTKDGQFWKENKGAINSFFRYGSLQASYKHFWEGIGPKVFFIAFVVKPVSGGPHGMRVLFYSGRGEGGTLGFGA